ncbi:MAG: hypothetical protein J0L60_12715 [Ignavibacteria bacterium]|nr:hypothetical protein [Ignavibacteria bacterium]
MKKILFITLISATLLLGQGISVTMNPVLLTNGDALYSLGKLSPDGKYALLSGKGYTKIELLEIPTGKSKIITENSPGSGWGMRWNRDSKRFLFKINDNSNPDKKTISLFEYNDGKGLSQIAGLDPESNNLFFYTLLGDGISTEGKNGTTQILRKSNSADDVSYSLNDGKLTVIDPSGKLKQGATEQISLKEKVLFAEWSPSGKRLAVHSAGNGIFVFDFETGKEYNFPKSEYPSWINDDYLVYMMTEDDGYTLLNSEVVVARFDRSESSIVTKDFMAPALFPSASGDGTIIFTASDHKIYVTKVEFYKN